MFGAMAGDHSAMMATAAAAVDGGTMPSQHAAVGMQIGGYPAMMSDINAMMMMSDVYQGHPTTIDQSAVKHMFHSVTSIIYVFVILVT